MDSTLPPSDFVQASVRVTGWCVRTREKRCQWYPGEGVGGGGVGCFVNDLRLPLTAVCICVKSAQPLCVAGVCVGVCVFSPLPQEPLWPALTPRVTRHPSFVWNIGLFHPTDRFRPCYIFQLSPFFPLKLTAVFPPRLHHHPLGYPLKCWIRDTNNKKMRHKAAGKAT